MSGCVTDMEKSQCDALKSFAEHCLYDEYEQHKIRQQLVDEQVYEEKRKELRALLQFAKYDLKDHLKLQHEDCNGIGIHCIQHGLGGCNDKCDHGEQCPDC